MLAFSILLIIRMVRRYRRTRAVTKRNCLIGIVFPILILIVYLIIIGTSLPSNVLFLLFVIGLIMGLWQGKKTKVWIENNLPRAQNTVWFLVIWFLSYALTHILVSIGHSMSLNVGIGAMFLTTAIALGTQGNIIFRLARLKDEPHPVKDDILKVSHPPVRKVQSSTPKQSTSFCRECGAKIFPEDRFCRNCRAAIQKR